MQKLKGSLCYLIGAIDYSKDSGKSWRRQLIQKCNDDLGLGIKFLDPTNKVKGLKQEVGPEQIQVKQMREQKNWDELRCIVKKIVRADHRCIDISDFVIMHLDVNVHTCGSYFELQSALRQKKPYFLIVEGGKENAPGWLFGILDHNYMFSTIDEVAYHLEQLSIGSLPLSDRWVLIREQLKEL